MPYPKFDDQSAPSPKPRTQMPEGNANTSATYYQQAAETPAAAAGDLRKQKIIKIN
jgi:hypothetical protein